jgi:hypothetical protein
MGQIRAQDAVCAPLQTWACLVQCVATIGACLCRQEKPIGWPLCSLSPNTRDGQPAATGRVPLNNSKNNFERAAVDVFSFPSLPNVGVIKRILIGHDNSGAGSAWHLNKVRLVSAALIMVT